MQLHLLMCVCACVCWCEMIMRYDSDLVLNCLLMFLTFSSEADQVFLTMTKRWRAVKAGLRLPQLIITSCFLLWLQSDITFSLFVSRGTSFCEKLCLYVRFPNARFFIRRFDFHCFVLFFFSLTDMQRGSSELLSVAMAAVCRFYDPRSDRRLKHSEEKTSLRINWCLSVYSRHIRTRPPAVSLILRRRWQQSVLSFTLLNLTSLSAVCHAALPALHDFLCSFFFVLFFDD